MLSQYMIFMNLNDFLKTYSKISDDFIDDFSGMHDEKV
jgi:hypothetical protein